MQNIEQMTQNQRTHAYDLFSSCRTMHRQIYRDDLSKCRLTEYDLDIDLFYHAQQQLHPGAARESSRRTSQMMRVFRIAADGR